MFDLKHWDKLIYIDADSLFVSNSDELFNYPDGSMVYYPDNKIPGGLSGLMVFCPRNHNTNYYKCLMQYYPCGDGELFGDLWYPVKTNPAYQIPNFYLMEYTATEKDKQYKILHFGDQPKPWMEGYKSKNYWYVNVYKPMLYEINGR